MEEIDQRLIRLEELVTHLERVSQTLNDVILLQEKRIDGLERTIGKFEFKLDSLSTRITEGGDPLDEKPPHY